MRDEAATVQMIAEYERLRKLLHELDVQAASVDLGLIEMERELPNDYVGERQDHETHY